MNLVSTLLFYSLTVAAQENLSTATIRVLESAQVPMTSTIYLKDVATFEGFEPAYINAVENIKVADNGEEYGAMTSQDLMAEVRPMIKSIEAVCNCKISLNLPRSLQNHTLQGDFSTEKVSEKILQALKSQCVECEYYLDELKVSHGSVPEVYRTWELDSSIKTLRGPAVVSVYFDKKALNPLVLQTMVRVKRPVLRINKAQSLGSAIDTRVIETSLADVTFDSKKIATLADLTGSELARGLPAGSIVHVDDLRIENIVRHGEPLSVEITHGSFHIKVDGIAQRNGRIGEKIPVRVSKTKKEIFAEVVGEGRVRMQR